MKTTRRFISAVMALAMVSAIAPMSAFAINQDDVKNGNGKATGTMTATYDIDAKYTVTIPAGVNLDSENSVSATFEASDVVLESGQKIKVTLNSADHTTSGATFHAQNDKGDSTATYTIGKGDATTGVKVGDVVAEFTENGEQSLTFSKAEGATYAGTHTETLTFGISVEDAVKVETLLTTITATGKEQASFSTANVATVSFSYSSYGSSAYLANWGWWGYGWTATVTPVEGYTITKCVFYDDANRKATDSEAPFVVETTEEDKTPQVNGNPILADTSKGIKKIEVYGYAN